MRSRLVVSALIILALVLVAGMASPAYAQDGKLKIKINVRQAYLYVDGKPVNQIMWSKRDFKLSPGKHDVAIYNYGYKPYHNTIDIQSGVKTTIDVTLEPVGGPVSPPFGRIQLEGGHGDAAVLLNGKTPKYHVGHVAVMNHNFLFKQELLVPPGTHQLTVLEKNGGAQVWSGEVTVNADERVIIDLRNGQQTRKDWSRGTKLGTIPRFKAGIASVTIAVAPTVINSFGANPSTINCLDSSRLSWATTDAVDVTLQDEAVDLSGEKLVEPRANTTYELVAAGPGGRKTESATVTVNSGIDASLSVSPSQITFRKVGDRILEHGTSTLTWSTTNADNVTLDPGIGKVNASGSRDVQPTPKQTTVGPVNETVTYTLHATNPCGGDTSRTADLRITGEILPLPEVTLASIFFPTDYPDEKNPNLGLVASQKRALQLLAKGFTDYLKVDPKATLLLEAHADERRSVEYNRALSQRRAAIAKQFLVDAGIPAANIETRGLGEDQPLDQSTVASLEQQNPNNPPQARMRNKRGDWLAYNRRVDIVLRPSGERSQRYYPHNADDSSILWQVPKPAKRAVEKAQ